MAEAAVRSALSSALPSADEETRDYAVSVATGVLDDAQRGATAADTAAELQEALAPLLEESGLASADVVALCLRLAAQHLGADCVASTDADGDDKLLDLRGIILAFAGRSLLRPCDFSLRRGHRYALVGQNGVGKTTLLTRVALGDIAGFPAGLRRAYVQHEVREADLGTAPALPHLCGAGACGHRRQRH